MDFWQVVEARHSIRDFRPDPVDRKSLDRMFHAASAAPSAMNSQPWRYHVATGQARAEAGKIVAQATVYLEEYVEQLGPERYAQAMQWYSSLGDAPVLIAVSMPEPESDFDRNNSLLSVGASVENLLLAATAEGLGSCNITFTSWVRDELAALFDIGTGRVIVSVIAVGHPSEILPVAPRHRDDVADWIG
ncbi:MAG TPA: nitroreductase family protein [Coriobacteriia bacterium]|nr:nitroreductase family protein [Coriobacteriia bacterium]